MTEDIRQSSRQATRSGIVLTGPTGAGKTDLAVRLADHLASHDPQIVSADAVSIYRELEIGTAKPPKDVRQRIRHRLMDIRSIEESSYSAGEFAKDFFELLPSLPEPVIVAGGTGFYIDAIVRGLASTPTSDGEIRERLAALESSRPGSLYDRLRSLDPAAAQKIGPSNLHRIIRAIEVCEITGGKFSERLRQATPFKPVIFVLTLDRAHLYRAIEARVRRMFTGGLPEEVSDLLTRFSPDLPAFSTIGYAEALELVGGKISLDIAVEKTVRRTRQLAKRQLTWWRNFRYEHMCFVPSTVSPEDILKKWKELEPCRDF